MAKSDFVVSYPEFFVAEFREETLWLQFSGNFFHNFQSFDRTDFLRDYFAELRKAREIKTVVFHSAFSASGNDEYLRFFLLECPERELGHFGFSDTMNRYELHRFCNMVDQTVLDILGMDKMFIHICTGDVISLFMHISLACDYRIISTNTVFHNIYQEIGMLPKGGGAYLLSRVLGAGKIKQLLLQPRISAQQAVEYRIADTMVEAAQLEARALEIARGYDAIPEATLLGVKRLVNYDLRGLRDYLQYETEQIIKIGQKKNFDQQ